MLVVTNWSCPGSACGPQNERLQRHEHLVAVVRAQEVNRYVLGEVVVEADRILEPGRRLWERASSVRRDTLSEVGVDSRRCRNLWHSFFPCVKHACFAGLPVVIDL